MISWSEWFGKASSRVGEVWMGLSGWLPPYCQLACARSRSHRDKKPASPLGDRSVDQPGDEQAGEYQVNPVKGLRVQVVRQGSQDSHIRQAPEPARHWPIGHGDLARKVFVAGRQALARLAP